MHGPRKSTPLLGISTPKSNAWSTRSKESVNSKDIAGEAMRFLTLSDNPIQFENMDECLKQNVVKT